MAQLVERHLAKVEVAGSTPVARSSERAGSGCHFEELAHGTEGLGHGGGNTRSTRPMLYTAPDRSPPLSSDYVIVRCLSVVPASVRS